MSVKDSTTRVSSHTKELILKHSRKMKISQNELIERAILCAEQHNFSTEIAIKQIERNQVIQANRIIGFIKTQDKIIAEIPQQIYESTTSGLRADRNEVLEFIFYKTKKTLNKEVMNYWLKEVELSQEKAIENTQLYMEVFEAVSSKIYAELRKDILTLDKPGT